MRVPDELRASLAQLTAERNELAEQARPLQRQAAVLQARVSAVEAEANRLITDWADAEGLETLGWHVDIETGEALPLDAQGRPVQRQVASNNAKPLFREDE